jgi:hypothetical protein
VIGIPGKPVPSRRVRCPCGELLQEQADEQLVLKVREHLRSLHPERGEQYTDAEILLFAF